MGTSPGLVVSAPEAAAQAAASGIASVVRRHPVAAYFLLAYAVTWAFEIPIALSRQGWLDYPVPYAIHYLASFGPLAAALLVTGATRGRRGVGDLLGRLLKWRVGWGWFLFSACAPVVLFALPVAAAVATGGAPPDLRLLGQVDYLPYLGAAGALVLWFLTYGLGEEVGWRGFALPTLQKDHSALAATLLLSVFWALWHAPAFFYRDFYLQMGLVAGMPMLLVSVAAAAIVFTWIYNSTGGSLLMVALFHGVFDFLLLTPAGTSGTALALNAAPMVLAVLLVARYRPANLSRAPKQVL